MKTFVVVPVHTEMLLHQWTEAWEEQLGDAATVIMWDGQQAPEGLGQLWSRVDAKAELNDNDWIIPQRSSACRSFGIWKAWQMGADIIITMDSDCIPETSHFVQKHIENLTGDHRGKDGAWTTVGLHRTRGFPWINRVRTRECWLSMGLWTGVPDLDAHGQLRGETFVIAGDGATVEVGKYFPLSGMNLAFRRELAPAMYFGLQGHGWPYDRFDDTWCGIIAKKILDHLGLFAWVGLPHVNHLRASNAWENLKKETPGYEVNEHLWDFIDRTVLTGRDVKGCYNQIANEITDFRDEPYWQDLSRAMHIWLELFQGAN